MVLGVKPALWEKAFFLLLGLVVATASKVAGALLVFCYLVGPPTVALLLARRIEIVLVLAGVMAMIFTLGGLGISFVADWPTNQTICALACVLAGVALCSRR